MENKNQNLNLDDAIQAMREDKPQAEQAAHSRSKIWDKLSDAQTSGRQADRLRNCDDFRTLLVPYMRNELPEGRRMLVDDHLGSCVGCRKRLDELRGNVRQMAPAASRKSPVRPFVPWAIAAGVVLAGAYLSLDSIDRLMAPAGARAELASVTGEIYKVSAAGLEPVKAGTVLGEKDTIRTARASAAVVRLPDGSLIEMNERAELSISGAYSGSTIHLDRGNIVVQAAKQKRGTLKVATRDSLVNVKGTIFSVAAGLRGTQVAVVEGLVAVEQNGKNEELTPGQVTASDAVLRRTNVGDQIAWSKDSARYLSMLGELSEIRKQIEALPMPALRTQSKLMAALPKDTVIYAAIPNVSGTIADATKIFESRLQQSSLLSEWWKSGDVTTLRQFAEKVRGAGAQIGDEIVFAAPFDAAKGLGEPFVIAEVKGASARSSLEAQIKEFGPGHGDMPYALSDRFFVAGATAETRNALRASLEANAGTGFAASSLGKTVATSYAKGAGWILAMDLEQILSKHVSSHKGGAETAALLGMNEMRTLMIERRDPGAGSVSSRSDTRATLSFGAARKGVTAWLAAPSPLASLEYISPTAGFAMSAVTKNARQMGEEFFSIAGIASGGRTQEGVSQFESRVGLRVLDDLLGPIGGEVTLALDGPLLPVPTLVLVAEVYDGGRLTTSLKRLAEQFNQAAPKAYGQLTVSEENLGGRTWYRIKASTLPVEMNFTFDNGYMIAAPTREAIVKAMQNRQNGSALSRSPGFRNLLPADASVNMSGLIYYNLGPGLKGVYDQMKGALNLPADQQKSLDTLASNQEPVLIVLYAEADRLTVASSSGFFGFGLENLLAAGSGAPILPTIFGSAIRQTAPFVMQGNK